MISNFQAIIIILVEPVREEHSLMETILEPLWRAPSPAAMKVRIVAALVVGPILIHGDTIYLNIQLNFFLTQLMNLG